MFQKLRVARETAEIKDPDFVINSHSDALRSTEDRSEGLELVIHRAYQYIGAGADLGFITYI